MISESDAAKDVTCGVLYRYGDKFLICHATLSPWWSIPKGVRNSGETLAEAAVRELREETGIVLKPEDLSLKGVFPYKKDKDLALFEYKATEPLDTEHLVCVSFYENETLGKRLPEVDRFKMVDLREAKEKLNGSLYRIVRRAVRQSDAS